jgi:hypothetical protein
MSEMDPLRRVLREWQPPEPSAALDARVRTAFRAESMPGAWRKFWMARVSIPVPVLAAASILVVIAWVVGFRPGTPTAVQHPPGVVTRLEATGFVPLPDGSARVVEIKQ